MHFLRRMPVEAVGPLYDEHHLFVAVRGRPAGRDFAEPCPVARGADVQSSPGGSSPDVLLAA
jgi:hypothetical protein